MYIVTHNNAKIIIGAIHAKSIKWQGGEFQTKILVMVIYLPPESLKKIRGPLTPAVDKFYDDARGSYGSFF